MLKKLFTSASLHHIGQLILTGLLNQQFTVKISRNDYIEKILKGVGHIDSIKKFMTKLTQVQQFYHFFGNFRQKNQKSIVIPKQKYC